MMQYIYIFYSYFYAKGGSILLTMIFLVSLTAWFIGIEKYLFLKKFKRLRENFLRYFDTIITTAPPAPTSIGFEPYDYLVEQIYYYKKNEKGDSYCMFREFLIAAVPDIERGFTTMAALITIAPLLGLLGTVNGMIQTFRVITDFGLGNPGLTAEGISVALLTTQAGLTVAFPMMIFYNYLAGRSRSIIATLKADGERFVKKLPDSAHKDKVNGTT